MAASRKRVQVVVPIGIAPEIAYAIRKQLTNYLGETFIGHNVDFQRITYKIREYFYSLLDYYVREHVLAEQYLDDISELTAVEYPPQSGNIQIIFPRRLGNDLAFALQDYVEPEPIDTPLLWRLSTESLLFDEETR